MSPETRERKVLIAAAWVVGTSPVWLFALFVFPGFYWWIGDAVFQILKAQEVVQFEARWSIEELANESERAVRLDLVDYPGYRALVVAEGLEDYLAGRNSETVKIEYRVTSLWGKTKGFLLLRVGEVERGSSWRTTWVRGEPEGPSPF